MIRNSLWQICRGGSWSCQRAGLEDIALHAYATVQRCSRLYAAASADDQIILQGLKFFGYHGVLPQETKAGQNFIVDATLRLDVSQASQHDDLNQTVNYAEVYRIQMPDQPDETDQIVKIISAKPRQHIDGTVVYIRWDIQKIVEGEPQQLIETVAEAVAYTILRQHPRVQTAVVRVDKPEAPIDGTFGTVAVEVTRSRHSLS